MGNTLWVTWGQFAHACFPRYRLLDSQALKCAACTCIHSCYSTTCWRFKPWTLLLCSWAYSPTAFMSFIYFMTSGFPYFFFASYHGWQYCLNYACLPPVIQKTHCCFSFILQVILNSSLQTIHLRSRVSSLTDPCCWMLLKAFETDPLPTSILFLFLYIFLIPWRNSFMLMKKIFLSISYPTLYFL